MKKQRILFSVFFALMIFSFFNICSAEDVKVEFLLFRNENDKTYDLNIVFPDGLYEYYTDKNHRILEASDFSSFVTPYVFEPVADKLWELYDDEEDFVNGVLMIVHQIDYEETAPIKYPIETMVEGKGDCDLFSLIAASVVKAGGLDVVLLYYEQEAHMNIGVNLYSKPQDAREDICYVTYENKQYYMAECTGENWMEGWRIGECPPNLKDVSVEVISLDKVEQGVPGQASASFSSLESSTLVLEITPQICLQNSDITIRGILSPSFGNQNVTIYTSVNNSPWIEIDKVVTNENGSFQLLWDNEFTGIVSFRASWPGNNEYASSLSTIKTTTVVPIIAIMLFGSILLGIIGISIALVLKKSQNEEIQPEYW